MTGSDRLVTVDGPAGSGKTTLGRRLAIVLDLPFVDTGLFYRGVMVAALRAGVDASDPRAAAALAARTTIEVNTDPRAGPGDWSLRVDGRDPGGLARDPRHATLLTELSAVPGIRAAVLSGQRRLATDGAVAVGRDCGTVVFPWARVKIWLWASAEVRARRRAAQLAADGLEVDARQLEAEIAGRDARDASRAVAPLRPAADAHTVDSGRLDIEMMVGEALGICRRAGLVPAPAAPDAGG